MGGYGYLGGWGRLAPGAIAVSSPGHSWTARAFCARPDETWLAHSPDAFGTEELGSLHSPYKPDLEVLASGYVPLQDMLWGSSNTSRQSFNRGSQCVIAFTTSYAKQSLVEAVLSCLASSNPLIPVCGSAVRSSNGESLIVPSS